jgi:hypothetical protein
MAAEVQGLDAEAAIGHAGTVLDAAAEAGVVLRATGGVGIASISPSARSAPLRRSYGDVDFLGLSRDADALTRLFVSLGYSPESEFNTYHGQYRLFFHEPDGRWEADVFLDQIEMCHRLDLRERLTVHARTLSPADLLLSKLQVVETNEKDLRDALALLADHELGEGDGEISLERIGELCDNDWGWWRTATLVAGRVLDAAGRLREDADPEAAERLERAAGRTARLISHLEHSPKSRRWKVRARVGERKRWYETPEDIEHEET